MCFICLYRLNKVHFLKILTKKKTQKINKIFNEKLFLSSHFIRIMKNFAFENFLRIPLFFYFLEIVKIKAFLLKQKKSRKKLWLFIFRKPFSIVFLLLLTLHVPEVRKHWKNRTLFKLKQKLCFSFSHYLK